MPSEVFLCGYHFEGPRASWHEPQGALRRSPIGHRPSCAKGANFSKLILARGFPLSSEASSGGNLTITHSSALLRMLSLTDSFTAME
jgi:hypothetical protein